MSGLTPYYDEDGVTIYHDDCREVIAGLPTDSVDVVITDPPYGVNYVSNLGKGSTRPLEGDDFLPVDWLTDLDRLTKFRFTAGAGRGRTAMFWFASDRSLSATQNALTCAGYSLRTMLVWDKQAITAGNLKDFGCRTEYIVYAIKGNGALNGSRDPNLISVPRVNSRSMVHPTQKPLPLLTHLVVKSSGPGDLIFDPFMGSGTTLLAARDLGRRAIGVEVDERYCEVAAKRLGQGVLDLSG